MRVAYVSGFADFIGGGEYSMFDLMTNLPVDVEPVLLIPAEGKLSARAEKEGIAWYVVPIPALGFSSPVALWAWRTVLVDIKPDLLHVNNSRPAFYAGLVGRMLHVPVVFHCRVAVTDPRLDSWLARLVNGVIANSRATMARFSAWPSLRSWTVHNGVDMSAWHLTGGRENEKPFGAEQVMLVVARVSRWKRHGVALDVFERLSKTMPGLHLVCVGGKDPMDVAWWNTLQQRTSEMRNGDRTHWIGEVDHAALEAWYAAADVLVLPSDDEPFGRVLVEAMAMSVPVVAFDGGGVPEVVQHGKQGLLVRAGDEEGMSLAVRELLGHASLRVEMGEAGQRRARDFSIRNHVARICKIYEEIAT